MVEQHARDARCRERLGHLERDDLPATASGPLQLPERHHLEDRSDLIVVLADEDEVALAAVDLGELVAERSDEGARVDTLATCPAAQDRGDRRDVSVDGVSEVRLHLCCIVPPAARTIGDMTTADPADGAVEAELVAAAVAVQANAHVPYSHFPVGAAVRTRSGNVFVGCNVENAAYPEGLCAEASAIAAMVSAGERSIDTVVTVCDGDELSTPCGGCRQKIREFADADTVVHAAGPDGVRSTYSMAQLLPDSFGPENLLRS